MTCAPARAIAALAFGMLACAAHADELQVAVAANFSAAARKIAAAFEADTGHVVKLSFGATGKFYAQIAGGAPFDLLLAADQGTPARLVAEGKGLAETRRTYAVGRLVLWSADPGLVDAQGEVLKSSRWKHLAIADPKLAPYGEAAWETLQHLQLAEAVKPRLVTGESIGQAFQFVASGNAELGFVALGQVQPEDGSKPAGSMWRVPANLYTPLKQDLVVLASTHVRPAATAFADYLGGAKARALIESFGYGW
jgi:molybdate transport system substrate-binding protein